jgi:hypothetical protein
MGGMRRPALGAAQVRLGCVINDGAAWHCFAERDATDSINPDVVAHLQLLSCLAGRVGPASRGKTACSSPLGQ